MDGWVGGWVVGLPTQTDALQIGLDDCKVLHVHASNEAAVRPKEPAFKQTVWDGWGRGGWMGGCSEERPTLDREKEGRSLRAASTHPPTHPPTHLPSRWVQDVQHGVRIRLGSSSEDVSVILIRQAEEKLVYLGPQVHFDLFAFLQFQPEVIHLVERRSRSG